MVLWVLIRIEQIFIPWKEIVLAFIKKDLYLVGLFNLSYLIYLIYLIYLFNFGVNGVHGVNEVNEVNGVKIRQKGEVRA